MATIVCQGLLSCLKSQILEPRTIRLKLSCSIDEEECHYDEENQISSILDDDDDDSHCWSFLQAISNNGSKLESTNKETTTYLHPLDARSKSTLSGKSLELCTENLGSETGTDIIEDDVGGSCSMNNSKGREQQKCSMKKAIARNFPPPLTTICGVASLQVRPHREDGRLIIKAIKAPSPNCSLFQAERSHGRLRLSLYRDSEDEGGAASCEEEEKEEEEEQEEEKEEEGDGGEDDFDEESDGYVGEDEEEKEGVNGNNKNVGGEMGIKKFQRAGRCQEGEPEKKGIGLLNWEALWVATS